MSLPRNKRKIIVDTQVYYWIAKGNYEIINLTIENSIGNKLFAQFDYDTLNGKSNYFNFPFVVTPYVVREIILYALNRNYSNTQKSKELHLGNMSKEIRLCSLAERKIKKVLKSIESRIHQGRLNPKVGEVEYVLKETREYIKYGELLIGIEDMIDNLFEISFEFNEEELTLIKDVSEMSLSNWKSIRARLIEIMNKKN